MNITTTRTTLRPFKMNDINAFFSIINYDEEKASYSSLYVKTKEKAREKIEEYMKCDFERNYIFAIEENKSRELIGCIASKSYSNDEHLYTDIFMAKGCRCRGYMKEALSGFISALIKKGAKKKVQIEILYRDMEATLFMKSFIKEFLEPNNIPINSKYNRNTGCMEYVIQT